jgi:hypothetical protein
MTASNSRQRPCRGHRARLLSFCRFAVTNASGGVRERVSDGTADVVPASQLKLVPQLLRPKAHLEAPDLTDVAVAEVYRRVAANFALRVPDGQPAELVALDDFSAFVVNRDLAVRDGPSLSP